MRRAHSQDQRDTGCRPRRNGSTRHGPGLSESAMPRIWIQLRGTEETAEIAYIQ